MELDFWKDNWTALGKDDPLWVVLTDETKRGGKWDVEEFFETGRAEVSSVFNHLDSLGIQVSRGKALDFGCGVGRLTQALAAAEFAEVHGVDISSSMIEHARRFNRWPDRCKFHINTSDDLQLFRTNMFDLIYSNIALQHIEPTYTKRYLREFLRILKPGGLAVFQHLTATIWRKMFPQSLVDRYRKFKFRGEPYFGMFGVPEREVAKIVEQSDGKVLQLRRARSPDLSWRWISLHWVIRKSG